MQKRKIVLATIIGLSALTFISVGTINAQFGNEDATGKTIIQRIAEKFNLNENDVETVFNDHRKEMWNFRQQNLEERLSDAVSEGKLTEDQKNKLAERLKKKWSTMDEYKNLSQSERFAKMEQEREEFHKWLTDNGIDLEDVGGMMFGKGEMMKGYGRTL